MAEFSLGERHKEKIKLENSGALPIIVLVKRTMIRLGAWIGPIDLVAIKMDDFDVVPRMEFLLEHQVIPMLLVKCLVINGSTSTIIHTNIRQPNGVNMITTMQLKKGLAQGERTFMTISLGSLENPGETVPKDIMCVLVHGCDA